MSNGSIYTQSLAEIRDAILRSRDAARARADGHSLDLDSLSDREGVAYDLGVERAYNHVLNMLVKGRVAGVDGEVPGEQITDDYNLVLHCTDCGHYQRTALVGATLHTDGTVSGGYAGSSADYCDECGGEVECAGIEPRERT